MTTLADIRTLIRNTAGVVRTYSFLPPHGRELGISEDIEVAGDIHDFITTTQGRLAFERAITRGDLTILRVPAGSSTTGPKAGVQTAQNLRDIAESNRADKDTRLVEDIGTFYRFDETGAGADDGDLILVPAVGTGRWFKTALTVTSDIANDSAVVGVTAKDALDTLSSALGALDSDAIANVSGVTGADVTAALNTLNTAIGALNSGDISNASGVTGADVTAALNTLNTAIGALSSGDISNASGVTGADVTAALNTLNSLIGGLGSDDIANDSTVTGTTVSDALENAGFFSGGGGTNSAIGKGTVAPTAAGSDALAHGDGSDAAGNNSFAVGKDNDVADAQTFAQGLANVIPARSSNSFAQGNANVLTNGGVGYNSRHNFMQGSGNTITAFTGFAAENNFVQGLNNTLASPSGALNTSFAQGYNNTVAHVYCFAQGQNNDMNSATCFAQGNGNLIPGTDSASSFIQGTTNQIKDNARRSFAQGASNIVGPNADNAFAQGASNQVLGVRSFAQGLSNIVSTGAINVLVQGKSCVATSNSLAQGNTCVITSGASFAQGSGCSVGANSASSFAQGTNCTLSQASGSFVQGFSSTSVAAKTFVQGQDVDICSDSPYGFAQGDTCEIQSNSPYSFVQGYANTIDASAPSSFAQGRYNQISGSRGFAQGQHVRVKFDDAKMWGTNRAVLGKAQHGSVGTHLQTTDATADQVVKSIPLDASSVMLLEAAVIGRGPDTKVLWTDRILIQVYRDAAGNAIINGAPSFTTTLVGFTTAAVAAPVVNGGAIELKVTGEAVTTIDWTAELKIIECVT